MACVCPDESCTQVVVAGVTYCDCLVSQDATCPEGSELTDVGNGVLVCRTKTIIEPQPCGILTCDVANGYVYNPTTQKCEKKVTSDPCPVGYEFVPTPNGVGICQAVGGSTGELVCPDGYTYDNGQCTKVTSSPAAATVVTNSCKADIIILNGLRSVTPQHHVDFVHRLIDNFKPQLHTLTFDYRVAIDPITGIKFISGTGDKYTNSGNTVIKPSAAEYLKHWCAPRSTPHPNPNVVNKYIDDLREAAAAMGNDGGTNLNTGTINGQTYDLGNNGYNRPNARRIVVIVAQFPPDFTGTDSLTWGMCYPNSSAYSSNYPQYAPVNFPASKEMSRTLNFAKCLVAQGYFDDIFVVDANSSGYGVVNDDVRDNGVVAGANFYGGKEEQFYSDLKTTGVVYKVNSSNYATMADKLAADILALGPKSNGRQGVCGSVITTYTCPPGQTLVGDQCQTLDIKNAKPCNTPCTLTPDGINARCTCSAGTTPTTCGTCPVVNNKCSCVDQKNPTFVKSVTNISLDDPKYFDKIEWTVSYDPKNKMWISFHDWHPTLMIPAHSHFYTINGSSFWKHNERFDSFTTYYDSGSTYDPAKDRGWEVEYNIVTPNQITTFRSVEYYMEAYKYFNDGKDAFHVLDENFDRAMIYNSEQVSPLLYLRIKSKNNPLQSLSYPIISSVYTQILASKEENKYRFNNFYDVTKDRGEFSNLTTSPMFITAPDGYHKTINPAYVDVFKAPLQHKKFRHFGNKIVLRKTKSGDKKMLLKLVNSKMLNSQR